MTADSVVIVVPECSDDQISADLRWLTEFLSVNGFAEFYAGGMLGGEWGYGVEIDNDVFMMHPFCWCEREDCDWCLGCTCSEAAYAYFLADGTPATGDAFYDAGGYRTGTCKHTPECDYCLGTRTRNPNFLHKPTGTNVSWYKYIGRDMEVDLRGDWRTALAECVAVVQS